MAVTKTRKATKKTVKPPRKKAAPPRKKVKLLAGGNPQVPKGDGAAPVKAYIAAIPEQWKREAATRVDALAMRAVPGLHKAVKWNSPFYGLPDPGVRRTPDLKNGAAMPRGGWVLSFHCFTRYLKVAFFNGAALSPPPPGASKQKRVRYLDIHEGDKIDEKRFAAWVRQASKLPGWG